MIDGGMIQTLVVGHLWQSVAIAAVLAVALILTRRVRGATRYNLTIVALAASVLLPLAAFIPGESLARTVLNTLDAPPTISEKPAIAAPKTGPSLIEQVAAENNIPMWQVHLASNLVNAATENGTVPASETELGKTAVENGASTWAIDLAGNAVRNVLAPTPAPQPKPFFSFPEIKLPDLNLPDLTLPLAMIWIAGALILLVRTARDLIAVERLVASAQSANLPDKLKARMEGVRVAVSADAPGPMAAGLFRPCIVLPENIALGSPGMAALLEHERAHIERCDMAVALLQRILGALLWWSPAVHWINKRIDEEREVACDEAAVDRTGNAKALARSLTIEAENQLWARAPRLAVGAIGPRSQVGRRIKRLIEAAKGAPYAKYSGRIAFACLALAVGVAAMVTPRFDADAQQPGVLAPVDGALDGAPRDEASGPKASIFADRDDDDLFDRRDLDDQQDLAFLGDDFASVMEELGQELEISLSGLSPEIQGELHGLSAEMAALGVEISSVVSEEVLRELPQIMDEVRRELEASGIDMEDQEHWREHSEEVREALEEAREELREALGPEKREEIRQAIEEARAEVSSHREEIRAALQESQAGVEIARQAMAQARAEIAAARARGDFERFKELKELEKFKDTDFDFDFDFDRDFDFDFDPETVQKLRESGIKMKDAVERARLDRARLDGEPLAERLYRAAGRCNDEAVKRLIADEKADVNVVVPGDGTPLIAAARRGCLETVRILLNADANPNLGSPGDGNPLIAAAQRGHADIAKLLLDRGANINAGMSGDGNALIAAAQRGEIDLARLLVDRGANVNGYVAGDETPLMNAAEQGELDMVKYLVGKGAKVNLAYTVETYNGGRELRSPLKMALRYGHHDVAEFLRSKGAVEEPKPAN